ncbi:unnamed protein product [marine sediment metagenome]|uniref:HNH nuclease domain-containing protein n=1 Tax=marine sediment metagenome TaxID=412755 RepID=X0ZAY5_9ZZZZ
MDKKQLKKAYRKAYYKANYQKISAQKKVYCKANAEKIKARKKAYYQANKEAIKVKRRIYYKANHEKILVYFKARREAHPEYQKIWEQTNPEKCREKSRKRRALKYKTQIEPINEKVVYLRDGWTCQHCKKRVNKKFKWPHPMSRSLDHIIPLSQGGTHTYGNIQVAHLGCNLIKNNNLLPQGEQTRLF